MPTKAVWNRIKADQKAGLEQFIASPDFKEQVLRAHHTGVRGNTLHIEFFRSGNCRVMDSSELPLRRIMPEKTITFPVLNTSNMVQRVEIDGFSRTQFFDECFEQQKESIIETLRKQM